MGPNRSIEFVRQLGAWSICRNRFRFRIWNRIQLLFRYVA